MSAAFTYSGYAMLVLIAYAFTAGIASRILRRTSIAHMGPGEYGGEACPAGRGKGPCECSLWALWAAFWPFVLLIAGIWMFVRHMVYEPIATAARGGFQLGRPGPQDHKGEGE